MNPDQVLILRLAVPATCTSCSRPWSQVLVWQIDGSRSAVCSCTPCKMVFATSDAGQGLDAAEGQGRR